MAFGIKALKPEIDTFKYYIHLVILATVALWILQMWKGGDMLTLTNVLYSIPILTVGDILAHSLLSMD